MNAVLKVKIWAWSILIGLTSLCSLLWFSAVDNALTSDDLAAFPAYLRGIEPLVVNANFEDELLCIKAVQRSVQTVAHLTLPIPKHQAREVKDLLVWRRGVCYDRSRAIEKLLRYAGFQTRHVAMYSTAVTHSAMVSLLTTRGASHAVTEVKTQKGWMVVGSNNPWVSIDATGQPINMRGIQKAADKEAEINWAGNMPSDIYRGSFVLIYGLYSRHGYFFPPYNPVPDVNYSEFIQNLWD